MTAPNRSNKFKKNSIAQILVVGVYKWPQKIPLSLVSAYFSLFCGPYLTFVVLIPLLPFLEESYVDCRFAVLSFLAPSTTASQEQLSQSTQSVGEPDEQENTQFRHLRDIFDKNQSATQLYKNQLATRSW